jgi:UDP-N-acetylmuramate--alanine ligase
MDGQQPESAHFVGACGAGMKALAELLLDANWHLSGSDLLPPNKSVQKLIQRGFDFHQGHHGSHVSPAARWLIYSPAIPLDNPERIEARRLQIPERSYGQMVGQSMRKSTGVCIAGTHGKSTTTAMTARILDAASRLSAVVLGAELCDSGRSGWNGSGDLFVAESCEFQQSFLEFTPRYAVILGVEPDHFDCYPDLVSLESAFRNFADLTQPQGLLLTNDDCPISRAIASKTTTPAKRVTFGFQTSADWQAVNIQQTADGIRFTLSHHGKQIGDICLKLHGRHNVLNALAAAALCHEIGVSHKIICETLASFQGIRRRFEYVGDWKGVTFVDDYAHHPTAVHVTLETIRAVVGTRRIRCVFQPHQVLRTTTLMDQFATSFDAADEVLVAPVFAARELVSDQPYEVSSELARRILLNGVSARGFASLDQIVSTLEDSSCPGDVIVTMGAGDIDRIHHEFTERV